MRPSRRQKRLQGQVAAVDAQARRQRTHDAHVFTTWLVMQFHTIVVESLNLKGMARSFSRAFRRSFSEAAMGQILSMLAYKCDLYGRTLVVAGKWFPSSKQCWACHQINPNLTLSDRVWTCACGQVHDRDETATFNLWQLGCDALGIDRKGMQTPKELTAGESPVAGRVGLWAWIGAQAPTPTPCRCSVKAHRDLGAAPFRRRKDRLTTSDSTTVGVRD